MILVSFNFRFNFLVVFRFSEFIEIFCGCFTILGHSLHGYKLKNNKYFRKISQYTRYIAPINLWPFSSLLDKCFMPDICLCIFSVVTSKKILHTCPFYSRNTIYTAHRKYTSFLNQRQSKIIMSY